MEPLLSDPSCRLCPLGGVSRSTCVLGDGPLESEILVLGINPGRAEDLQGRVFVGKSGQLLREMLREMELTARIENIVSCWTPGNREPTSVEIKACSVWLERRVRAMTALKYVIALGALPMKVCGVDGSITKLAGVPRPAVLYGREVTVIPIMHPAGLMRRPSYISTWESHWHQTRELIHPREQSFADTIGSRLFPKGLEGKDWRTV